MAALQPEAGCGSAEVDSVSSAGDHRLPAIVGCHLHSHGSEPFLYGSKKFLTLLEFSAYGACHRFAREIILSGAESSAEEDEARLALQGGDNRIAYSPQVVGDTDCVRYSQANIQGLLSEEDLIRVDYVAAQQLIAGEYHLCPLVHDLSATSHFTRMLPSGYDTCVTHEERGQEVPWLSRNSIGIAKWSRRRTVLWLSLIHISEPTRLRRISYAVFC